MGSSDDVWKLGLTSVCSNIYLETQQMLMHEKTCVIPMLLIRKAWWQTSVNSKKSGKWDNHFADEDSAGHIISIAVL